MAVVWLNQSISGWDTPAAFDYWDENTQSIQPYEQTPQNGDTFYLNGYNITGTGVSVSIPNGKISNALNPYTDKQGGSFTHATSHTVSCKEIEVGNTTFASSGAINQATSPNYTGNIYLTGTGLLYNKGGNYACSVTINGNVFRNSLNAIVVGVSGSTLRVNGNYEAEANVGTNVTSGIIINGNCTLHNASLNGGTAVSTINISGDITLINARLVETTSGTTTLGGHNLYYDGTIEPIRGLIINSVVINSDDFSFHNLNNGYKTYLLSKYQLTNTEQYPIESDVRDGIEYAFGAKIGTMTAVAVGCVTKEDVREGVALLGMSETGTLVVPSVDDVREGVIFDNGSVGTLIVQGGGDRLRIADFGFYTRSTSITYIVDLTESDKPAFADCEEIVLRSLFPTLDLDNIPDKFFDDLFVQFLRYRLLVEYYRGISVNSKFTPSEPTTEIVNYANTKCEYWLNTANLFLQLWGEKYPNSVKKDRILL